MSTSDLMFQEHTVINTAIYLRRPLHVHHVSVIFVYKTRVLTWNQKQIVEYDIKLK